MKELLNKIVNDTVELIKGFSEDKYEVFPDGSCVGVCAFVVPFIRLFTDLDCQLAAGEYDGKNHVWIACFSATDTDYWVDPTVHQFDKSAPIVIEIKASRKYRVGYYLSPSEEDNIRRNSEFTGIALSSADGKRILKRGRDSIKWQNYYEPQRS